MPFSHRNLLGEFSICPVYMGMNLNIRMYECGFGDLLRVMGMNLIMWRLRMNPPRVYGDESKNPNCHYRKFAGLPLYT